jgi:hypothetical protein
MTISTTYNATALADGGTFEVQDTEVATVYCLTNCNLQQDWQLQGAGVPDWKTIAAMTAGETFVLDGKMTSAAYKISGGTARYSKQPNRYD